MLRLILTRLVLFFLPFAGYAFFLVLKRKNPLTGSAWKRSDVVLLSLAGFFLSIVLFGFLAQHAGEKISGRPSPSVKELKP
jgi:hypothetical protein